jgi:hypothetical protein
VSASGYQTLVHGGATYLSIGAVAQQLGRRDSGTIRRLERAGILPRPRLVTNADDDRRKKRWYSQNDVRTLGRLAAETGFVYHKHRRRELAAAIETEKQRRLTQRTEPIELRQWTQVAEVKPEPEVRAWSDVNGERRRPRPLPERCPSCSRKPVVTGVQRPTGERVLVANCDRHGQIGVVPW